VTTDADEILTRATIERILTRYFVDGDRSPDVVTLKKPRCEVDRNVARIILERSELSEEDLSVFGHFYRRLVDDTRRRHSTSAPILDILRHLFGLQEAMQVLYLSNRSAISNQFYLRFLALLIVRV